ncbi:hyaluronan-mediated motility receptor-like [Clytia hemisphaerica]|uniref:Hyaluronan-mediated motility receptor C-terminal domain-containing protein n=1 Tax=Clytia hemisphaerica TaxID=252671 RepID=A0A7M5UK22_9CNID
MFSKSKRFVDEGSCAPPVGLYSVPDQKSVKLAGFEKSARWLDKIPDTPAKKEDVTDASILSNHSLNNKSFNPMFVSSVKKKKPPTSKKPTSIKKDVSDPVRKSLEVDVEFQQSKVNALLEKIKSLEIQLKGTQDHSDDLEKSNEKLHELLGGMRNENAVLLQSQQAVEESRKMLEVEKTKAIKDLDAEIEQSARKLEELKSTHENEKTALNGKLQASQDINVDFRIQLESVESMMTDNLRDLSQKYENLEETLGNVQSDYKMKLQRSNSLVEKIKQANENSKHDLEVMHDVYNNLKHDYEYCQNQLIEMDTKSKEKESDLMQKIENLQGKVDELTGNLDQATNLLNEEKDKSLALSEEFNRSQSLLKCSQQQTEDKINECLRLTEELEEINLKLNTLTEDKKVLRENLDCTKRDIQSMHQQHEQNQKEYQSQIVTLESAKSNMTNDLEKLRTEYERSEMDLKKETERSKTLKQAFQEEIERLNSELDQSAQELKDLKDTKESGISQPQFEEMQKELESWKMKYEELETRVGPFMSQLEQFEFEKQALLSENAFTQHEMNKLSEKYAQILGHQNNKQKIHHIRKLKEENLTLKNDAMKLRAENTRLKRNHIENRENKFDQSKAFQGKENRNANKQPLKPCNF